VSMTADHVDAPAAAEADGRIEIAPIALEDLGAASPRQEARPLRLLAGVQVELTVEIGRSRLPMHDLLTLAPGAVVELDRPADAAVDILVNGTVVARGEVVVVDGEFGVRITEITGTA
jgi:flagellar motor switch protein FliN/FliY